MRTGKGSDASSGVIGEDYSRGVGSVGSALTRVGGTGRIRLILIAGRGNKGCARGKAGVMPDLTDSDVMALARAARIDIPAELVAEVGYSLNGLLDALEAAAGAAAGVNLVEPLPIVIPQEQSSGGQ